MENYIHLNLRQKMTRVMFHRNLVHIFLSKACHMIPSKISKEKSLCLESQHIPSFSNKTILIRYTLPLKMTQRIKSTSTVFKQTYRNIKGFTKNKRDFTFGFLFSSLKEEKNKTNQLLVYTQNDT